MVNFGVDWQVPTLDGKRLWRENNGKDTHNDDIRLDSQYLVMEYPNVKHAFGTGGIVHHPFHIIPHAPPCLWMPLSVMISQDACQAKENNADVDVFFCSNHCGAWWRKTYPTSWHDLNFMRIFVGVTCHSKALEPFETLTATSQHFERSNDSWI